MSASDEMHDAFIQIEGVALAIFDDVIAEATRSIVEGSELTGAPGQPVDTDTLRASWITEKETATRAAITTNLEYAEPIELGIGPHGPLTLRSEVGGFGSVAATVAGMDRIVAACAARQQGFTDSTSGFAGEDGG